VGSIPITRSTAHIAQSVEHFLGKEEVTGSNPVMGSSMGWREYLNILQIIFI
jgi:hypothetical protein